MSRLEKLIKTLCPDGVEYRRLGDVSLIVRGVTYSKSAEVNSTEGHKILRANNITLASNTINFDDVRVISDSVIINSDQMLRKNDIFICTASGSKDHIGKVAYIDQDLNYYFGGFMAVIRTRPTIMSRFLFHLMISYSFSTYLENTLNSSTINNLNSTILKGFSVPIPPLPVQEEIVRMLDTFTALEAELEKELEARTKQYEYYRDALLNFDPESLQSQSRPTGLNHLIQTLCPDGVELVPLWTVTTWDKRFMGVDKAKQPRIVSYPNLLAADLFSLKKEGGDIFLLSTGEQTGWTTAELAGENLREGEVVTIPWGKSRPVKEVMKYYKGRFVSADNRIATSTDTEILLNKFLYYWMGSQGDLIDTFYRGSGIKHPSMAAVLNMSIPLPPLPIQEEIVAILDRFEALVSDLKNGLPAEIALRRKQYEYYRDQLLTFPPLP